MAALVGNLTSVWNPFDWTLLLARQPEPDLEFTEEELDQTIATKAKGPVSPRKKSGGGSPILWILLLALVGGIAYVSMNRLSGWRNLPGEALHPAMKLNAGPRPWPMTPPQSAQIRGQAQHLGSSNHSRHCRRPCSPSSRSTVPNGNETRCTSRTASRPDVQRRTESDHYGRRNGSRRKYSVIRRFIEQQAWASRSTRGFTDRNGR
jgi:hypothetical protein